MIKRFSLLGDRVEKLRGTLRGFTLGYIRNPCVTVYNQMMAWFKEANVSIYSSIMGECYPPVVQIVDKLVLNFRKDLARTEEQVRGVTFGHAVKEESIIL